MTFGSNVAPRKIIRPAPRPWTCRCYDPLRFPIEAKRQPGYLARCPVCKSDRPKEA